MKNLIWLLKWVLRAAIFFTLFAFALNNQQDAAVHFFFGTQWRAPMVVLILSAFAAGLAVGVLGMVPRWWKHRAAAKKVQPLPSAANAAPTGPKEAPTYTNTASEPLSEPPHGI